MWDCVKLLKKLKRLVEVKLTKAKALKQLKALGDKASDLDHDVATDEQLFVIIDGSSREDLVQWFSNLQKFLKADDRFEDKDEELSDSNKWKKPKLVAEARRWFARLKDSDISVSYLLSTFPMIEF